MRQYERYLLMHLLLPTLLVTAALTGIIWLTQMMRFIEYVLNRGLTIGDFLYLTGLMLPSLLLILIPISLGIAVIYTYHRLTTDSELIVLNAVGISKLQMARPAMLVGSCALVICYALSLYFMPLANQHFKDVQNFFRDKYVSVLLEEEVFNNPVDGMTVFVRQRDGDGTLHGILLHDDRNPNKPPVTMLADRGRLLQGASGPRFYLEHGVRQQIEDGRVSWLSFDNYTVDVAFYAKDMGREREPSELMLPELLRGSPDPQKNRALHAEAHQRLGWPLLCLVLPMLALALLSAGEFNRRGQWRRLVAAACGVGAMVMLFFVMRSLIVKHAWMTPALYLMCVCIFFASLNLLFTGRYWWTRRPNATPRPA